MSIKVNNLFFTYLKNTPNEHLALNDINIEIKSGSFTAIIGETGSGKSTFVQHLNALLLPDSGSIEAGNFIITGDKKKNKHIKELRKLVGLVFQFPEYQLFEETVIKDVMFGPKNFGLSDEEARKTSEDALKSVGIKEEYFERSPFELSGGEKRRVAIAGILAINPDVLVLDEPTAGLDPIGQEALMSLITKLHDSGKTIILVTHDMNLVMNYASDVIVFDSGKIVFSGTPIELFSSEQNFVIEMPLIYQLVKKLNQKGFHLSYEKIHNVDELLKEIKETKRCKD